MFNLDDEKMASLYILFKQTEDNEIKPILETNLGRFFSEKFNEAKITMERLNKSREELNKSMCDLEDKWKECQIGAQYSIEGMGKILTAPQIALFSKKYKETSQLESSNTDEKN
jgi:hypothetical protein